MYNEIFSVHNKQSCSLDFPKISFSWFSLFQCFVSNIVPGRNWQDNLSSVNKKDSHFLMQTLWVSERIAISLEVGWRLLTRASAAVWRFTWVPSTQAHPHPSSPPPTPTYPRKYSPQCNPTFLQQQRTVKTWFDAEICMNYVRSRKLSWPAFM